MNKVILVENFAIKKITQPFIKQFFSAVIAGIIIGIAYSATLLIICYTHSDNEAANVIAKWCGGILFSIGLIGCCLMGASLFTGNCAGFIACKHKRVKWRYLIYDLIITLIGNWLGSVIIVAVIFGCGLFSSYNGQGMVANDLTARVIAIAVGKVNLPWWQTLLCGIICNILVIGCLIAWITLENKAASILAIVLLITCFLLSGYQHIVANLFIIALAGFLQLLPGYAGEVLNVGRIFWCCLLFTSIGNTIGGFFLIWSYYAINSHVYRFRRFDPPHIRPIENPKQETFDSGSSKNLEINRAWYKIENKYNSKLNEYEDQYHEICRNYNEQCKLIIKNAPKEERKQLIAELKSDKKNKIKALNQKIYNTRYEYSLAYAKFNENLKYKKPNEKKTIPTPKKRKSKK